MTPQFGASLSDDARVTIYNHNMFIIQATVQLHERFNKTRRYFFQKPKKPSKLAGQAGVEASSKGPYEDEVTV